MRLIAAAALAAALGAALGAAPALAAEVETSFQQVVVKKGDTLWSIANLYLKDPARWDEILKYNRLPSSDPTVALPGMTLSVPVRLIKEDLRAAQLIYMVNRVDFRRKETADWKGARERMDLFKGDALRTLDESRAKVKFLNAELLSVDPNSLVIIKPPARDGDLELRSGSVFTGRSRVITASASITAKTRDTQFSTQVTPELTTRVAVHRGLAAVEGQGRSVDVKAGMATEVKIGMAPSVPTLIPDLPQFNVRAAEFNGEPNRRLPKLDAGAVVAEGSVAEEIEKAADAAAVRGEVASLRIGVPISAYRVQASLIRDFEKPVFDKFFEPDEKFDLRYEKLAPGVYWFRIALIDLLGTQGKFSEPRLFSNGLAKKAEVGIDLKSVVVVAQPGLNDEITSSIVYKVVGVIKNERVTVTVAGKPARQDDYGNFSVALRLKEGPNDIPIVVSDAAGNTMTITRRVTFNPY